VGNLSFDAFTIAGLPVEPVTFSLPFAQGALPNAGNLRVLDGSRALPLQTRVLSRWPDGSMRWVLAHVQADLPGDKPARLTYDDAATSPASAPARVSVQDDANGWRVNTGPLDVLISRSAFDLLHEVRLNGKTILEKGAMNGGFAYQSEGRRHDMAGGRVESTEWVERGPLRALLTVKGRHSGDNGLGFRVSLEFYAGKPWVRVQYQIIMDQPRPCEAISSWDLRITPPGRATRCEAALGHYRCNSAPGQPGDPKRIKINAETALYSAFESIPESYVSNCWADWDAPDLGGVALSVFQAMQNLPKAVASSPDALEMELLPSDEPPLALQRGMAKTHSIQLHFHPPASPLIDLNLRSFLFQLPCQPRLEAQTYAQAAAFHAPLPARRYDRLDYYLHHRACNAPRAFGILHWGDYVEHSYTAQGRGKGRPVWCNGEYDPAHVYYFMHAIFGERWLRDYAAVSARHWMDVDLCHDSDDPLIRGGLFVHSAGHNTAGVGISHEWLCGLLDHYHFTGEAEALEAALSIGENILRHLDQPAYRDNPTLTSTRSMGWALRSLGPLWVETGDPRYRKACEFIADTFLAWAGKLGGMTYTYTEHLHARIPFMISLTCESLRQWAAISGDKRVSDLIVRQARDLVDHCIGLGGLMYYKEPPFLHRRQPMLHVLPPLAEAWRLTGDPAFLRAAYRVVEAKLDAGFAGRKDVASKIAFEDAVLLGGESWVASDLEPLLYFYSAFCEAKDSKGAPVLDGLDFRKEF